MVGINAIGLPIYVTLGFAMRDTPIPMLSGQPVFFTGPGIFIHLSEVSGTPSPSASPDFGRGHQKLLARPKTVGHLSLLSSTPSPSISVFGSGFFGKIVTVTLGLEITFPVVGSVIFTSTFHFHGGKSFPGKSLLFPEIGWPPSSGVAVHE